MMGKESDGLVVRIVGAHQKVDDEGERHVLLDFLAELRETADFDVRPVLGRPVAVTMPFAEKPVPAYHGRLLTVTSKPTDDLVPKEAAKFPGEGIHRYTGKLSIDDGGEKMLGVTVQIHKLQADLPLAEASAK